MTRRTRIAAAWLAFAALLFAQLATAAYACPQMVEAPAVAMPADCEHQMAQTPNLCERHCDYGNVSVDTSKSLPPMVASASPRALVVTLAPNASPRAGAHRGQATGPPLTRFTVLRI